MKIMILFLFLWALWLDERCSLSINEFDLNILSSNSYNNKNNKNENDNLSSLHDSKSFFSSNVDVNQLVVRTGTTIVGFCCEDGVVLGADTRTTGGSMVMNKWKQKIHKISNHIYCCTAGTVADCDFIIRQVKYDLSLLKIIRSSSFIETDQKDLESIQTVLKSITNSFIHSRKRRSPEAVFILGGVDSKGNALFAINMNGIGSNTPYCSLGSGSTKAYSILESEITKLGHTPDDFRENYVEGVNVDHGVDIVRKAIHSGIQNDLGSGSHIDLVVITKDHVKMWREELDSISGKVKVKESFDSNCHKENQNIERSELGQRVYFPSTKYSQVDMLYDDYMYT